MKKMLLLLLITSIFLSCKQKINQKNISNINGYWEIERVDLPDADHKEYRMNEVFDYFAIQNNKGYRKKVMPQLDGTFLANDTSEKVEVVFVEDKVFLKFKTEYAIWQEELIEISDQKMTLVSDKNIEYQYKKTAPINLLDDGNKTK
jgi:hypothetical protein